jgi:small subunit ribosomal protein S14
MSDRKTERVKFAQFELKSKVIKAITHNKTFKSSIRWYFSLHTSKKRKKTSKVRIKNRCVLSGRSRSFYRFAKLSRLFLRENQYIGSIVGLRKSFW